MSDIVRVKDGLIRDYGYRDWSLSLRAGPESIGILGKCLLLTSRPDVMGIKVQGPGLTYDTLFANVSQCFEAGADTFRNTADRMKIVTELAYGLSRDDGTITKILSFCNPDQGEHEDAHLQVLLNSGENEVSECVQAIQEFQDDFDKWSLMTANLRKGLEQRMGENAADTAKIEREKRQNQNRIQQAKDQLSAEQTNFQRTSEKLSGLRGDKAWYDERFAGIQADRRGPLPVTSLFSPIGILGAAVSAVRYNTLQQIISHVEYRIHSTQARILELSTSAALLESDLGELDLQRASIAEVSQAVNMSLIQLTVLQQEVHATLDYLKRIALLVKQTASRSKVVYATAREMKTLVVPRIKEDLRQNATEMRARFAFIAQASEIYTEISERFILPTIVNTPRAPASDDGDIEHRLKALEMLRLEMSDGAAELSKQKLSKLKESVEFIAQSSTVHLEEMPASSKTQST